MANQKLAKQRFSSWLKEELKQREWTQAKLIQESSEIEATRLKSGSVSKYLSGQTLPDVQSCLKLAHALKLSVEIVLEKTGLIQPILPHDWIQRIVNDVAQAVNAGLISREAQHVILAQLRQAQHIRELEGKIGQIREEYDFHVAHVEELPKILQLAARTMGEENIFSQDVLEAWLQTNPDLIHVLQKGTEVVGYISFLPLPISIIELRLAGKIRASDIPVSAIERLAAGKPLTIYLAEAIVDQTKPKLERVKIGARLISDITEFFLQLAHKGIFISKVYMVSTSDFSRKICEALECQVMNIPGAVRPGRIPFKLDINKSNSVLIRYYRQTYKY